MNDNELKKIREAAESHTVDPRPEAWERLQYKLGNKKAKMKVISYRNLSIAAVMIAILSITAVFTINVDNHNPKIFSSNEQYRPIAMEDLDESSDPFYSTENIDRLYAAYARK